MVKRVTISLDDETYRMGQIKAAQAGRSLTSLVREILQELGRSQIEQERLDAEEKELR